MKIAFIGGGNMGEAMLAALLSKKLATPSEITVSAISTSRRGHLEQQYGVTATADNRPAAAKGDIVVLAVKPQQLAEAMFSISGSLQSSQLALSIADRASLATLCQGLRHDRVVRAMPNTPAQVGSGITVWTASAGVTARQKKRASDILGATGKEIYFDDEKYLDMATAVSGSGPAYFFLFVESLVESAVNIGMPQDTAEELVLQTILGSAQLIQKSGKAPAELRRMVTSPGGTTAAAMLHFEQGGFAELVRGAVRAAYEKASKLGSQDQVTKR